MSIKDLFGKTSKDLEETVQDVESVKFVEEKSKQQERYLPPVDFSDPKNFVYYGSAELYYDAAIRRIYEDYPYDGSKAEQIEFEEKSSHLERWLFENRYPKTTGYIELGTTGNTTSGIYVTTSDHEYIRVWGGLHTDDSTTLQDKFSKSAKYDNSKNRNQNWNCDFDNGVTIEFWLKKSSPFYTAAQEVILDLWNGETLSSQKSHLLLIASQISGETKLSLQINSDGSTLATQPISDNIDFFTWNHFSLTLKNDDAGDLVATLYKNGDFHQQTLAASGLSFSGRINGTIGAMQTTDYQGAGGEGQGKLSAYLDEFRFWKTARTARQIKLNWFSQVGGGANTDDATSDLGVYFKFNEGIVGNSATDSVILDYSGRLANGLWVGYPGSSARNTGSAIEAIGYHEPATPIIYSNHPEITALSTEMQTSGSFYDSERGQAFYNSMPTWLQQDDNGNLRYVSQILASYLDTLHVQIKQMTELKNKDYTPEGLKASTMAQDLLKDKGFLTSNIFGMNEVYEKLSDLDIQDNQFESDLNEIKNTIYTNIYNNLEKIYKSKGTETSIRNFIRCFGIDDELVKLNLYTDGGVQYLSDKSRVTSVKKKYINFNHPDHFSATIYQTSSDSNVNTFIDGSSTGTNASNNAFTLEADIVVPYKKERGENGYFGTPFLSSSVFGFHQANEADETDYSWVGADILGSPAEGSIAFDQTGFPTGWEGSTVQLTSTDGTIFVYQFDSIETGVANGDLLANGNIRVVLDLASNQNSVNNFRDAVILGSKISVVQPGASTFFLTQVEDGSSGNTQIISTTPTILVQDFEGGATAGGDSVDLQAYLVRDSIGSNHAKFVLKNEAETIYQESNYIYDIYDNEHYNIAIRIKPQTYPYAGGVTNATPDYDIELYAVTNNLGEIKEEVLLTQTVGFAIGSAYMNVAKRVYAGSHVENFTGSVLQKSDVQIGSIRAWLDYLGDEEIQNHNKDVLNYGSRRSIDGSNIYTVDDQQIPTHDLTILNWDFDTVLASDGSGQFIVEDITSGSIDTIYGWVDDIIRREHRAQGDFFPSEDSSFLSNEFLYSLKKQLPETAYNSENIFIKGEQEINFSDDDDVSDNLFILEKSPANLVSEEMLKSFSTTMEFANLIGRPIDRYRLEYKDLAKARELFFNKVESDLDFDRFFEYFKWIDSSISSMVNQLIPLSANFAGGIVDVIEPHILERDKYQRQIGLLNTVTSTEASIRGVQELNYNWKFGHAPVSGEEADHFLWQKERKERETSEGEQLRQVFVRQTDQEFTNPINLSGSDGVYQGNAYATRRFSKPYSLNIGFSDSIHGGINYSKNKDRDFLSTVVRPHGELGSFSGAPKNIMTIGAGDGHGLNALVDCNDVESPNKLIKRDGEAQVGKFSSFAPITLLEPLNDSLHYLFKRKLSDVFPGNIVSSSVNTGYASKINKSGVSNGFKEGVNVVNLHSDTTDITNEIPIQGPFTEQWVGGHQSRHVNIATGSATLAARPEAWRLLIGQNPFTAPSDTDGAMGFTGPDYGGPYPVTENLWAIYYREERAKRPVNIKNIKTIIGTGSAGNYVRGYEVFSTFGDQGYFLRRHADVSLLPPQIAETLPQTTNHLTLVAQTESSAGNIFGQPSNRFDVVAETQDRSTGSVSTIRTKFSAPGGPEVNTSGYFDVATQQYSVHNSINFRNLTVRASGSGEQGTIRVNSHANRREGLRTLRARHQGQFGIDSQHGAVSATDYISEASFHKQHRNGANVPRVFLESITSPSASVLDATGATEFLSAQITENPLKMRDYQVYSFWAKVPQGLLETSGSLFLGGFSETSTSPLLSPMLFLSGTAGDPASLDSTLDFGFAAASLDPSLFSISYRFNFAGLDLTNWHHYALLYSFNPTEFFAEMWIDGERRGQSVSLEVGDLLSDFPPEVEEALLSLFEEPISSVSSGFSQIASVGYLSSPTPRLSVEQISALMRDSDGTRGSFGHPWKNFWTLDCSGDFQIGNPIPDEFKFRNTCGSDQDQFEVSGSSFTAQATPLSAQDIEIERSYDNDNITSLLPSSDFQYSWIKNAISGSDWGEKQRILGFAPKSGVIGSTCADGYVEAIVFPDISKVRCESDVCTIKSPSLGQTITYDTNVNGPVDIVNQEYYELYVIPTDTADGNGTVYIPGGSTSNPEGPDVLKIPEIVNEIWDEDIEGILTQGDYYGCCEDPLEYKLTVADWCSQTGEVIDWSTQPPQVPKVVYAGEGACAVAMEFFVRDCEDNERSTVVIFHNGAYYSAPSEMSLTVGFLSFIPNGSDFRVASLANPDVTVKLRAIEEPSLSAGANLDPQYDGEIYLDDVSDIVTSNVYQGPCDISNTEQRLVITTDYAPVYDSGWLPGAGFDPGGNVVPEYSPAQMLAYVDQGVTQALVYYDFYYRDCVGCAVDCDTTPELRVRLELDYCLVQSSTMNAQVSYDTVLRPTTQTPSDGANISVIPSAEYATGQGFEILTSEATGINIFADYDGCCPDNTIIYSLAVFDLTGTVLYASDGQTDPTNEDLSPSINENAPDDFIYIYTFTDCLGNTETITLNMNKCVNEATLSVTYQEETSDPKNPTTEVLTASSIDQIPATGSIQVIKFDDIGADDPVKDIKETNVANMIVAAASNCCADYTYSLVITDEDSTEVFNQTSQNSTFAPPDVVWADDYVDGGGATVTPELTLVFEVEDCIGATATLTVLLENAKLPPPNPLWTEGDTLSFTFTADYLQGQIGSEQTIPSPVEGHEGDYVADASDGIVDETYTGLEPLDVVLLGSTSGEIRWENLDSIAVQGSYYGPYSGGVDFKLEAYNNPTWTTNPSPDYVDDWDDTNSPTLPTIYYSENAGANVVLVFSARTPERLRKEIVITLDNASLVDPNQEYLALYASYPRGGQTDIVEPTTTLISVEDPANNFGEIPPSSLDDISFEEVYTGQSNLEFRFTIREFQLNDDVQTATAIKTIDTNYVNQKPANPDLSALSSRKVLISYQVREPDANPAAIQQITFEKASLTSFEPTEMSLEVEVDRITGTSAPGLISEISNLSSTSNTLELVAVNQYTDIASGEKVVISDLVNNLSTNDAFNGFCAFPPSVSTEIRNVTTSPFVIVDPYQAITLPLVATDFQLTSGKRTDIKFSYDDCHGNQLSVTLEIAGLEYIG